MILPGEHLLYGVEHQPLIIRRASTRDQERLQFQRAQEQAVGDVAASGGGFLIGLLKFFVNLAFFAALALYIYIYVGSVYIILCHLDDPCDQPLGAWLVVWMILPTLHHLVDPSIAGGDDFQYMEARRRRMHRQLTIHSSWFLTGYVLQFLAQTCQKTNAQLFNWVYFVIHVYLVAVWMLVLAPLLLAIGYMLASRLFQTLIDNGYVSNPNAAKPGTIDLLETVPFRESLFSTGDDPSDKRPAGECCCCTENFGPDQEIVRTRCGHYYHKRCLGEWLKLARTCPLCRSSLDGDDAENARDGVPLVAHAQEGDEDLARRLQAEEP